MATTTAKPPMVDDVRLVIELELMHDASGQKHIIVLNHTDDTYL